MPHHSALLRATDLRLITGAHIDLTLAAGSIHCISGPSGAGKTRLLRALAELDPVSGEIFLDGRPSLSIPAHAWRRQVMLSPAQPRWWLHSVAAHCRRDISASAAALLLAANRLQAPVEELSTGEQARAGLLRALSHDPTVLLLDEPTGALDPASAAATEKLLLDWLNPQRAILWVSHDQAQIARVADTHSLLSSKGLQTA